MLTFQRVNVPIMKKLLIIAYHFPPCALSGPYRTMAWVRLLAQRGWDITVVTVKNLEPPLDYELLKKYLILTSHA